MEHWKPGPKTFFKFQGPVGQIRVPQNRSAPGGTNQGPAARTRDPKGESGFCRTDQSPQKAKGPDRSGPHVTDLSMWEGSGPCRSNQDRARRGTDQGPVGQIRGAQDETGHRRTRTNRDPWDRPGPSGTDQSPTRRTRARKTNQGLQDEPRPCGTDQGPAEPTRAS